MTFKYDHPYNSASAVRAFRRPFRHGFILALLAASALQGVACANPAAPDLTAPLAAAPAAPSQTVTEIPPGQKAGIPPAMPPALTPEPANGVSQETKNAAALPSGIGGPALLPSAGLAPGAMTGTANEAVRSNPGPTGPDTYYDSTGPVPTGPMARAVGPRKLNPADEPGSKFVIVEKNQGPDGRDAQMISADRALKLGRYESAVEMYDALYARYPRDPRVLMGRAVAYQNTGRPEMAAKMYDALLDVDPHNLDAQVNMLGMMSRQYPEVALRRLLDLQAKHPGNATLAAQVGVTEAQQGQFEDAMRFLGMAASMQPDNAQHQFNLAVVADKAGKKADAVKYYQHALETDAVYGASRSVPRDKIYDRLAALRRQ